MLRLARRREAQVLFGRRDALPRSCEIDVAYLRASSAGRAEIPNFAGSMLMPSAGIPLGPSFVRSIHALIARSRPFVRVQGTGDAMKLLRRNFLHLAAGAGALLAASPTANAQSYPNRTVRIVVGFPAGQAIDISARLMAEWLQQRLGQSFIVENRPGAAANVATEMVARSSADGYTLLVISSNNVINTTLYGTVDFAREIAPIATFGRGYQVLNVNNSLPVKTVPELIAFAKAHPGKLNMASPGIGSAGHVAGEMFKMMTGVNMLHVPYRGSVPALTDLMSGQVQVMFDNLPSSIEHIRAGRIRALAVTPAA